MKPKLTVIIPMYNAEDTILRALNSVQLGKDIQLVLLDDGSTDATWDIALKWWREHAIDGTASVIHRWSDNHGVAATMNLGYKLAKGEWIVSLSSDDWYVENFDRFRPLLNDDNDLIFFDLVVNDGTVWHVDATTRDKYVGAVKFIRRDFLGTTRIPNKKWHEDIPFTQALYMKDPRCVYTGIVLKHYNWPREGSLIWQATHQ